jgi:hypothetical protein
LSEASNAPRRQRHVARPGGNFLARRDTRAHGRNRAVTAGWLLRASCRGASQQASPARQRARPTRKTPHAGGQGTCRPLALRRRIPRALPLAQLSTALGARVNMCGFLRTMVTWTYAPHTCVSLECMATVHVRGRVPPLRVKPILGAKRRAAEASQTWQALLPQVLVDGSPDRDWRPGLTAGTDRADARPSTVQLRLRPM